MNIELTKTTEISKADIVEMSSQLIAKLDKGEINPFVLTQHLKAVEKVSESIKNKLTETMVAEAQKHPKGPILMFGAEFKLGEFGTKYLFTECNDPVYNRLFEECEKAKKALKEREDFLKTIKGSETLVDPDTAEIVTVFAPTKTSTTGVSCSIK